MRRFGSFETADELVRKDCVSYVELLLELELQCRMQVVA